MSKISIIIPAFNEEGGIEETLLQLNSQTNKDFEVIVVNNASTDSTQAIAEKLISSVTYPLKVLFEEKPGPGNARKKGADDALKRNTPILVGTDADCDIDPHWIEGIVASLKNPHTHAVAGKQIFSIRRLKKITAPMQDKTKKKLVELFRLHNFIVAHTLRKPLLTGTNFGIKSDVYTHAGGFVQLYHEGAPTSGTDWDLGRKLYELGYRTSFTQTENPQDPRRLLWRLTTDRDSLYDKVFNNVRPQDFTERLSGVSDERMEFHLRRMLTFQMLSPILNKEVSPKEATWFLGNKIEEFCKDIEQSNVQQIKDKEKRIKIREQILDKYFLYIISNTKELYSLSTSRRLELPRFQPRE